MSIELGHSQALRLLHDVSLQLVREGGVDLSNRQLAILLTIYLEVPPHTVRGLAHKLNVTKPVITRALDAMGDMDLVARRRDPADRRNVIVQRTVQGALYLEKFGDLVIAQGRALPP
jgi:DNA-binding MarR family transcriptional regulator